MHMTCLHHPTMILRLLVAKQPTGYPSIRAMSRLLKCWCGAPQNTTSKVSNILYVEHVKCVCCLATKHLKWLSRHSSFSFPLILSDVYLFNRLTYTQTKQLCVIRTNKLCVWETSSAWLWNWLMFWPWERINTFWVLGFRILCIPSMLRTKEYGRIAQVSRTSQTLYGLWNGHTPWA